jgi:hypothetical protein
MTILQLKPGVRQHLEWDHGLTIDGDGNETLRGLTPSESLEYLREAETPNPRNYDRYFELHDRHTEAKFAVAAALEEAQGAGPKN